MKCDKCGGKLGFLNDGNKLPTKNIYEVPKVYCDKCYEEYLEQINKEIIANAPEIKCPFCEKKFKKITEEQYRDSLESNIARGIIFLPWGVVQAIKNRPYIECPHCKMKIMQG